MHDQGGADPLKLHIADLDARRRELQVLNDFAVSLISIQSIDELLWYVAREVVAQLGFVDCVIYTCHPIAAELVQVAASGEKNPEALKIENRLRIPIGQGITGRVAESGNPILICDAANDPRVIFDLTPAGSEVCVPILVDGKVFGVIDSEDPEENAFDNHHTEILTTVAALTASKIKQLKETMALTRHTEVLDQISEVVLVTREDGSIVDVNAAATKALRMTRNELLQINANDLYVSSSADHSELTPKILEPSGDGLTLKGRMPMAVGNGKILTVELSITPYASADPDESLYIIVARDVTKQVEAEASLRERNQVLQDMSFELRDALEQSRIGQRTQAAFLANVSHELRTPLNAIVGFSDIMRSYDFIRANPEKVLEYNQYIHSAGQHLTSLVNDILSISSLAANETEAHLDQVELPGTLENCVTLTNHKATQSGIALVVEDDTAPPHIVFDLRHLKQVITNLLDNAIKFSPEGSTVRLIARRTEEGADISVIDEGRGIEPEQLEHVFAAFSRADWVRSQEVEGAGLGLALVREMVAANGCDISVESTPGDGATFTLHIPKSRIPGTGDAGLSSGAV